MTNMVQDEVSTTPATDDVGKVATAGGEGATSSGEENLAPTAESSSVSSQHTPTGDGDVGALPSNMPRRKSKIVDLDDPLLVDLDDTVREDDENEEVKANNKINNNQSTTATEKEERGTLTKEGSLLVDLDDTIGNDDEEEVKANNDNNNNNNQSTTATEKEERGTLTKEGSLLVDLDDSIGDDDEEEVKANNDNNNNNNQSTTATEKEERATLTKEGSLLIDLDDSIGDDDENEEEIVFFHNSTATATEKEERPTLSKEGGGSSFLVVKDKSLRSSIVEAWGEDGPMDLVEEQAQSTTRSQPQPLLSTTQLSRSTSFDEALISEHMNAKNSPSDADDNSSAIAMRRRSRQLSRRKSSMLAVSDDPFALREGKTLLWRNVNMTLKSKKSGGTDRKLLDSVWGEVPETETTAIMGPSGAGKTSLLNILAGRATSRGRLSIDADVRLNNYTVDPTDINVRKHIAFVAQDDSLQVTSTPRESIYFSAKLRLPRATPEKNLQKLVKKMLRELGLENCADTYVGGALLKGISGGERKRTSIGVELVVRPAMVFLDEPTSGLDSFSAVQLCQVLKKVANAGSSVLFTIHQPASEIFSSFDSLILMNKGRVMYQGHVEDVPEFFKARGDPLPPKFNPADWVMSVAQSLTLDELVEKGYFPKDERKLPEPFAGKMDGKNELGITITEGHSPEEGFDESQHGFIVQIRLLFTRELKNITRDKAAVGARFGLTTFLSILVGVIFLDVGQSDPAEPAQLQSQFGALIMVVLMSMFGTAQPALLAFPEERPVFLREYSTNHYTVVAYFLSRLTMEASITAVQIMVQCLITYFLISFKAGFGIFWLTIYVLAMSSTALAVMLGCAVEDPKLGQEMLPLLFVPQMLFAGFFVTPDLIPAWLRWARYLCSLTYAIRIIMVEEFGYPNCGTGDGAIACESLLISVDADPDETWWNWLVLVALFAVFRLFGLRILQQKAVKFF